MANYELFGNSHYSIEVAENGFIVRSGGNTYVYGDLNSMLKDIKNSIEEKEE